MTHLVPSLALNLSFLFRTDTMYKLKTTYSYNMYIVHKITFYWSTPKHKPKHKRPSISPYVTYVHTKHTNQRVKPFFKLVIWLVLARGSLYDSSLVTDFFVEFNIFERNWYTDNIKFYDDSNTFVIVYVEYLVCKFTLSESVAHYHH